MKSVVRHESDVSLNGRSAICGHGKRERVGRPIAFAILILILAAIIAKFVIIPMKHRGESMQVTQAKATSPSLLEEAHVLKAILALKAWVDTESSSGKVMEKTILHMSAAVTSEIYWHQTTNKERELLKEIVQGKESRSIPLPGGLRESLKKLGDFEVSLPRDWHKDFNIPSTLSRIEADKIKADAGKVVIEKFRRWKVDDENVIAYVLGIVQPRTTPPPKQIKKKR